MVNIEQILSTSRTVVDWGLCREFVQYLDSCTKYLGIRGTANEFQYEDHLYHVNGGVAVFKRLSPGRTAIEYYSSS